MTDNAQPVPADPAAKAAVDAATILEQKSNHDGSLTLKVADGSLQTYDPETGDRQAAGSWQSDEPDKPTHIDVKFHEPAPVASTAAPDDHIPDFGPSAPVALSTDNGLPPEADPVGGFAADSGARSLNGG